MKKSLSAGIFYGSVWGMLEATLGYLLHFVSDFIPGISSFIMFPIGFSIMFRAYRKSSELQTVLICGITAAAIKLVNFFLPVNNILKVVNPSISIFMESMAVLLVIFFAVQKGRKLNPLDITVMTFGWRTVYLIYLSILRTFPLKLELLSKGTAAVYKFWITDSIANIIIISTALIIFYALKKENSSKKTEPSFLYALIAFFIAISAQLIFSVI
ncbi:MAG TPA: hypothetical protein PK741_10370 [Petrotogaceae bacterium]|nr:hypothetical protein [Petrotogaceae bacterium]